MKNELLFTKTHEWVLFSDETTAKVGITDYAQHALGDLVFVSLPEVGKIIKKRQSIVELESFKAASDVFSPVAGEVAQINEELIGHPEKINEEPYESWMVEISNISDKDEFMTKDAYEMFYREGK